MEDAFWFTLTHARLRAAQGDRSRARQILDEILRRSPDDAEAAALLHSLSGRSDRPRQAERAEAVPERRAAACDGLAPDFRRALAPAARRSGRLRRIERLAGWLRQLETR